MDKKTVLFNKNILSSPVLVLAISAILFLPPLFIGNHSSHDWGDDFVQYIHQAKSKVDGIPEYENQDFVLYKINSFSP